MPHERGDGFQQPERGIYATALTASRARPGDTAHAAEQAAVGLELSATPEAPA